MGREIAQVVVAQADLDPRTSDADQRFRSLSVKPTMSIARQRARPAVGGYRPVVVMSRGYLERIRRSFFARLPARVSEHPERRRELREMKPGAHASCAAAARSA
jgi:hypothetical protein